MTGALQIRAGFLRWGGAAVGALLLAYGAIEIVGKADSWRARAAAAERESARRGQLIAAGAVWAEARKRAERDAAGMDALVWRAPSEGQARAAIQDYLSKSLNERKVERPTIRVDRVAPAETADLAIAQVTVGGAASLPELERWLAAIASAERLIVVDRLRVQSQPAARFEAVLLLPMTTRVGP